MGQYISILHFVLQKLIDIAIPTSIQYQLVLILLIEYWTTYMHTIQLYFTILDQSSIIIKVWYAHYIGVWQYQYQFLSNTQLTQSRALSNLILNNLHYLI